MSLNPKGVKTIFLRMVRGQYTVDDTIPDPGFLLNSVPGKKGFQNETESPTLRHSRYLKYHNFY